MKKIAKHLQSILEAISHGIVECDFLGNIVFCNRTFSEMVSYDREELIGLWIVDLSADDETRKKLTEIFESTVSDSTPIVCTSRLIGKDGRQRSFQVEWSVETDNKGSIAGYVSVFTGITDRGLEGEETARSLLNALTDMAVLIDKEGGIVDANEIAEQGLGNSADELIGLSIYDLFTGDIAELIRTYAGEVLRSGKSVYFENRHDGKTFENSIHPVFDAEGEITNLAVFAKDITVSKNAEEALRDSEDRFRKVVELSPDAIIIHSGRETEFVNEAGIKMFLDDPGDFDFYVKRRKLDFVHPDSREKVLERAQLIMGREETTPLEEMRFLRTNGESFYGEITATSFFTSKGEQKFIVKIHDITVRKQAESALRDSEEKYREVVERANDAIVIIQDNDIAYINPCGAAVLGYTPEEVIGTSLMNYIHPDYIREALERISKRMEGEVIQDIYESVLRHRDGSVRYVEMSGGVIQYDGMPADLLVGRDITGRKEAEEALQKSEERYRLLADNSSDIIWTMDLNANFTYMSPSVEALTGFTPDEVIKNPLEYFMGDESASRAREIIGSIDPADVKGESSLVRLEMKQSTKKGEVLDVEIDSILIHDENGNITGIQGSTRDVTRRKTAEDALRDSEEKYRELVENINDVIYTVDAMGMVIYISPAVERLYGYSAADIIGRSFLEFIHADDREKIKEGFELALKGSHRGNEYRLLTKSGEQRWFITNFSVIFNGGKTSCLRGTLVDVTERKQAEEALRNSEERYRRIFENIDDIYYEASPDGIILEISPSVERIGGYTMEELIGSSAYDVYEMPADRTKLHEVRRSVGGHVNDYRLKLRRKDGTTLHCSLNSRMVFDEFGNHVKNIGLIRDMSDRNIMEEALRESESKYRTLVESASVGIILSQDGRVVFANPKVKEMLGYSDREITSMTFEQFIAPEDRDVFRRQHEFWMKGLGFPESTDYRMLYSDRSEKWIEVKSVEIEWQGSTAVMSFLNDINARKIAEEKLKYRIEFEDIITSIATQFVNLPSTEIDTSINQALKAVGEFAGVDRTYIFLLSEDMKVMSNVHEWCAKGIETQIDKQKNLHLEDYQWFWERIKGADIVYIPRVSDLPPEANSDIERIKIYDVQSLIIVPMFSKESLVGFLGMDSVKEEKAWPDYIFNLLKILAEIFVNLLERKQKDDILNMYDNIISSSREQISFIDHNGIFQAVNGAFVDAFEMKRDEIIGHSLEEVFGEEVFRDNLKEYYQQCLSGHDKKFERWFNYPALGQRYMEVSLYPFYSDGVVSGIILNLADITDRVEIEKDILDISSRERRKIGLDLHDDLGHYLLGIAIKCRILAQKLAENPICGVDDALSIEESINKSIEKTRRLAKGIFPINLEKFGLAEMVKEMIENIGDVGMSFKIDIDSFIENSDIEILRHLYFIIEEGVLNAVKHSGAAHVDISLIYDGYYFILRIRDNGVGMPEVIDRRRGLGLSIMSYRARMISSSLDISRIDGGGTEIIFRFKV